MFHLAASAWEFRTHKVKGDLLAVTGRVHALDLERAARKRYGCGIIAETQTSPCDGRVLRCLVGMFSPEGGPSG